MTATSLFPRLRASAANSPITLVHQVPSLSAAAVLAISVAIIFAAASAPSACAQTVTYTGAAVNFGTANVCPTGKTTPAPCSKTLTLTYNVTEGGTLGTPKALTTGAPNLDYKLASGSTCNGSVTKGNTCTVNVTFAPTAPGARNGAVEVVDTSGNVLATTYIYGTGGGPLVGFGAPASMSFGGSINFFPYGVAVDASQNVFVADFNHGIKELLAVDGSLPANPVVKVLNDQYNPFYVAVDGAGNVFFTTYAFPNPADVIEILAAGGYTTTRTVATGFAYPYGVAVDGSGNVFVSDAGGGNRAPTFVYEIPAAGGYTAKKTLGGGFKFTSPVALAVDGSGNVFVADESAPDGALSGVVDEIMATGDYATVKTIHVASSRPGQNSPNAVAIDPGGNLFVAFGGDFVGEALAVAGVVPPNPAIVLLGTFSISSPAGIALDSRGNLFGTVQDPGMVEELQLSTPAPFSFAATYVGETSSDSPQSIQVLNQGNANLDASSLSISANWSQVPGSGTPADCAASFSLVPGAECNLSISFEPAEAGPLTGAVTLVDNSLNIPGSTQSIQLSGTGVPTTTPYITSLNSNYGSPYSVVILTGVNFGATKGSSTVTFNGVAPPVTSWSNISIIVTVPGNATTGKIVVTVEGHASNGFPFTVLPMPVVTGITPTSGGAGTTVTINGKNLLDYGNRGIVTFQGVPLPILSESSAAIQVQLPYGVSSGAYPFHVLVNDTGIDTPGFTVPQPEITGLSTNYGAPYSVVTLTGTNFGATQGSSYIVFTNGNPSDDLNPGILYWSNTRIILTVPANASKASNIVMSVATNYSNLVPFTVLPVPVITGISPSSGPVGTIVTISGNNLVDDENKGTVTFNGKSLPILSNSSTAIKVAVPTGAVTGDFHVLVNDTGINTRTFTVTQ